MRAWTLLLVLTALPATSRAEPPEGRGLRVGGEVVLAGKWDDNLELARREDPGEAAVSDLIGELGGRARLDWDPSPDWFFTAGLRLRKERPVHYTERGRLFTDGSVYLGRLLGRHTVSLQDELHVFQEPRDRTFDLVRNGTSLVGSSRVFDQWEVRVGAETLLAWYPKAESFDYRTHGGFLELRNPWTDTFDTYLLLDKVAAGLNRDQPDYWTHSVTSPIMWS